MVLRAFPWLLCLLLACGSFVGCGPANNQKVVKIVSSLPRTGSAKDQTTTIVNGIRLAIAEAGGKVGEYEIQYLDMDDATAAAGEWTSEAETSNAQRAARDADVMVYIGPFNSGAAKVSMPILNQAGLLMISPANTNPGLTKPEYAKPGELEGLRPTKKLNYTRVVPTDELQGPLTADFAQKDLKAKTVFILDDNQVYGKGIADLFHARCKEIGLEVLGHDSVNKAQEYKSLMTSIQSKNPDVIYFGGTTQTNAPQLVKDMVAVGLNAKMIMPDGCFENAFITAAGAENLNERVYITFGGLPPDGLTGDGEKFVKAYKEKYNGSPEAYAVYGYECGKVAVECIRRGGKDRAKVVEAAFGLKDFQSALGTWSVDPNGDTTKRVISVNTVRDGKFAFVKELTENKK